jgi:hypothetical protein
MECTTVPSRVEAIAQLEAHGHRDAADYLRRWRNRDGRCGGWDSRLKRTFPALGALLWPEEPSARDGHERRRESGTRPALSKERELRETVASLRRPKEAEPAFDAYWAVDWSALSTPGRGENSLWWALLRWSDDPRAPPTLEVKNPPTRQEFLDEALRRLSGDLAGARVLLGFDFPFGYPRGFAAALGGCAGDEPAWRTAWTRLERDIRDDPDNGNNRFEVAAALNAQLTGSFGPFWGRPKRVGQGVSRYLSPKRRGCFEYRSPEVAGIGLWESRAVDRKGRTASSPWFVYGGSNSVGGQALLGIPRVAYLRRNLTDARVWPFETGPTLPGRDAARVVLAEIYPSLFLERKAEGVKDKLQVMAAVLAFAEEDARGGLSDWFAAPVDDPAVLEEEGWVLGVGEAGRLSRLRGG